MARRLISQIDDNFAGLRADIDWLIFKLKDIKSTAEKKGYKRLKVQTNGPTLLIVGDK